MQSLLYNTTERWKLHVSDKYLMATFNKLLRKFIYTKFYFTGNELLKRETLFFLTRFGNQDAILQERKSDKETLTIFIQVFMDLIHVL